MIQVEILSKHQKTKARYTGINEHYMFNNQFLIPITLVDGLRYKIGTTYGFLNLSGQTILINQDAELIRVDAKLIVTFPEH